MSRFAIAAGLLVILGMCIFPPWEVTEYAATSRATSHNAFRPFWAEVEWSDGGSTYEAKVDMVQLLIQLMVAVVVTSGLSVFLPGASIGPTSFGGVMPGGGAGDDGELR